MPHSFSQALNHCYNAWSVEAVLSVGHVLARLESGTLTLTDLFLFSHTEQLIPFQLSFGHMQEEKWAGFVVFKWVTTE